MLLPFQGAPLLCMGKPRVMPWARCCWAFSPRQFMRAAYGVGFLLVRQFQFSPLYGMFGY